MSILDAAKELLGLNNDKVWTLEGDDGKFSSFTFTGQFIAEGYNEGGGDMNLGESSTLNKSQPNYQYLSNDGEVVTFNSRLYATDSFKSVKTQIELLRKVTKRDEDLRRPPKFLFTYGTEIQYICFVKKVSFAYDELRSDGTIRGAVVSITLEKLEQTYQGSSSATTSLAAQVKFAVGVAAAAAGIVAQVKSKINIPGGSLHTIDRTVVAKDGDTYESIAAAEYGSAIKGDILRRTQPDKTNLIAGDKVILVDSTEVNEMSVTPQSIPIKNTRENLNLREDFFKLRNRTTTVFV